MKSHDEIFLILLRRFTAEGRNVNDAGGKNYAPTRFAGEPEALAAGITKKQLAAAMHRLLKARRICTETYGELCNRRLAVKI